MSWEELNMIETNCDNYKLRDLMFMKRNYKFAMDLANNIMEAKSGVGLDKVKLQIEDAYIERSITQKEREDLVFYLNDRRNHVNKE